MFEVIASSFIMFGNPSIWSPNNFAQPTEQLYDPLLETFEDNQLAQRATRRNADER